MKDHQVIIGTRHDTTCARELAATVAAIFTRHGFEVHENVSGYAGGNIVTTYGQPETHRVHALQLEVNASLLMTTSRSERPQMVCRARKTSAIPPVARRRMTSYVPRKDTGSGRDPIMGCSAYCLHVR